MESSLVEKSSKIKEYSSLNESNIKELEEQRKLIENLRRFLSEEKSKTCMLKEDLQLVFIISSDYFFKKKKEKKNAKKIRKEREKDESLLQEAKKEKQVCFIIYYLPFSFQSF